jgi:hypothetical protein
MGEWRYSFTIPDLGTIGEPLGSKPGRFTPGERAPGTHCIGGWMGLRAGV